MSKYSKIIKSPIRGGTLGDVRDILVGPTGKKILQGMPEGANIEVRVGTVPEGEVAFMQRGNARRGPRIILPNNPAMLMREMDRTNINDALAQIIAHELPHAIRDLKGRKFDAAADQRLEAAANRAESMMAQRLGRDAAYISIPKIPVTGQKSLDEVGKAIADAMGVPGVTFEFQEGSGYGYQARWIRSKRKVLLTQEPKNDREMRAAIVHELMHSFPEFDYMPKGMDTISVGELAKMPKAEFEALLPHLRRASGRHPQEFYDKHKEYMKKLNMSTAFSKEKKSDPVKDRARELARSIAKRQSVLDKDKAPIKEADVYRLLFATHEGLLQAKDHMTAFHFDLIKDARKEIDTLMSGGFDIPKDAQSAPPTLPYDNIGQAPKHSYTRVPVMMPDGSKKILSIHLDTRGNQVHYLTYKGKINRKAPITFDKDGNAQMDMAVNLEPHDLYTHGHYKGVRRMYSKSRKSGRLYSQMMRRIPVGDLKGMGTREVEAFILKEWMEWDDRKSYESVGGDFGKLPFRKAREIRDYIMYQAMVKRGGDSSDIINANMFNIHPDGKINTESPKKQGIVPITRKEWMEFMQFNVWRPSTLREKTLGTGNIGHFASMLAEGVDAPFAWFENRGGALEQAYKHIRKGENVAADMTQKFNDAFTRWMNQYGIKKKRLHIIAAHMLKDQPNGRGSAPLEAMGWNVNTLPELTSNERKFRDKLDKHFAHMLTVLNTARKKSGRDPIQGIENYLTIMHLTEMIAENGDDVMDLSNKQIQKKLGKFEPATTVLHAEKERKGGASPIVMDLRHLFESYNKAAMRHAFISPILARSRTLLKPS